MIVVVVVAFVAAVVVTTVQKKTMIKIIIEIGSSIVSLCGMGYRTLLRLVMTRLILVVVVVVILLRSTYIDFVFVLPSHDEDDDDSDDYRQSRSEEVDTHPSFSSSKMWSVPVSNDAIYRYSQLALFSSTGNISLYFCCCCYDDIL